MSLRQFVPPPYKSAFSHTPGVCGWLAGTAYYAECFPTACVLYECRGREKIRKVSLQYSHIGPSADWTVFFDTLHQKVTLQGHSQNAGFFRIELCVEEQGIFIKSLKGDLALGDKVLQRGEKYRLIEGTFPIEKKGSLLLGVNKEPNLDRIQLHPNLLEILPLWYQLSSAKKMVMDNSSILGSLSQSIERGERLEVAEKFLQYYRAGISSFFVPKVEDDCFLGYGLPPISKNLSLEHVNGACAAYIRSLFIQENETTISLLPCLPKECASGRLLRERLHSGSEMSMEWRKGTLRRVLVYATRDEALCLSLQPMIKTFRITTLGKKNKRSVAFASTGIYLEQNTRYLLDNFA